MFEVFEERQVVVLIILAILPKCSTIDAVPKQKLALTRFLRQMLDLEYANSTNKYICIAPFSFFLSFFISHSLSSDNFKHALKVWQDEILLNLNRFQLYKTFAFKIHDVNG